MGFHLVAVLLSPLLLCLLGALATALWPRRLLLWAFLAPAWVLAAMSLGLLEHRHELAGPVLRWCRVDAPGLWSTALAMPLGALFVGWQRGSDRVAALREQPWRCALWQGSVAALGLLPAPCFLAATVLLRGWVWRWAGVPTLLGGTGLAALLASPWPGWVDLLAASAMGQLAVGLRPATGAARVWIVLASGLAALALWRSMMAFA